MSTNTQVEQKEQQAQEHTTATPAPAPAAEAMDVTDGSPDETLPEAVGTPAPSPVQEVGAAESTSRPAASAPSHTPDTAPPASPSSEDGDVDSDPLHSVDEGGCWICHRNDEQQLILLCDGCEGEYHTFCHTPQLQAIPGGDWFCTECVGTRRDVVVLAAKKAKEERARAAALRKAAPPPTSK